MPVYIGDVVKVQYFFFHFYLFVSSVNLVQDLRHPPQHQNMKCPLEMLLLVGDGQGQTNLGQFSIILRAQNKILWFFSIFLQKLNMSRTYWDSLWDCLGLTVGLFGTVWDCLRLPGTA